MAGAECPPTGPTAHAVIPEHIHSTLQACRVPIMPAEATVNKSGLERRVQPRAGR